MDLIKAEEMEVLLNPGVRSVQLLNPRNSGTTRVTLTWVTVEPGGKNPRHSHADQEQTWIAVKGTGELLLADGRAQPFHAGEVARFGEGDVHGFQNGAEGEFQYISVTTPPADFTAAYRDRA